MKNLILILMATLPPLAAFGQSDVMTNDTRDRLNSSSMSIGPNSLIYGFDTKKGEVLGDYYFDKNWQEGRAVLYPFALGDRPTPDTLSGVKVRLDLNSNEVEFKTAFGVKVLPGSEVKWLELRDNSGAVLAVFLNQKEVGQPEPGLLLQLLSDGKLKLVLQHKIWVKTPTYNPALNVGNPDTEIIKVKTWFYVKDGKLTKFKPTNGSLLKLMKNKYEQMESFLQANPVDANKHATVAAAFNYYESL